MKKWVQVALSVSITAVILFFIFRKIRPAEVIDALSHVDVGMVFLAFCIYIIMTLLKGLRWRTVLGQRISRKDSFVFMSVNNMFNNLLPFRLGEFSMLYLMKKRSIRMFTTFSFLIILRLFDLFTILVLFFAGVLLTHTQGLLESGFLGNGALMVLTLVLGLTGVLLVVFFCFHRQCLSLAGRISGAMGLGEKRPVKKILSLGKSVSDEISSLAMKRVLWIVTVQSCLAWLATFAFYYVLLLGMGINLPFQDALLALAVQMVLSNIPIQGFAGFGTYEGFWLLSFALVGVDEKTALVSGINSHLLLLVMTVILGLFGLSALAFKGKA